MLKSQTSTKVFLKCPPRPVWSGRQETRPYVKSSFFEYVPDDLSEKITRSVIHRDRGRRHDDRHRGDRHRYRLYHGRGWNHADEYVPNRGAHGWNHDAGVR